MNILGRIITVCGLMALVGCGPQDTSETNAAEGTTPEAAEVTQSGGPNPPLCPEVMPPPCEDGSLYPIYGSNGCLIGFECR